MIKTICDWCEKEMPTSMLGESLRNMNFAISRYGKCFDICDECRQELKKFIESRKPKTENNNGLESREEKMGM